LWQSKTGGCISLDTEGLIIGVKPDFPYEQKSVQLCSGDALLLYTDGVVEAENDRGEFFGEDRLNQLYSEYQSLPAQEVIDKIFHQVRIFTGLHIFSDDISMVVMKVYDTTQAQDEGPDKVSAEEETIA
jgi:serine phosphatase RsbU (regulator of sigma subunit)